MPRGLIPDRGKRQIAYWLAMNITHGAVGRGDWTDKLNPPLEDYMALGLKDEIGRITIAAVRYLVPDAAGTIRFEGDPSTFRYATEAEVNAAAADPNGPLAPSADVEFEFIIPANVMNGDVICELGLFAHAETPTAGYTPRGSVTKLGQPIYTLNIPADSMYADKEFQRRVRVDISN